MEDLDKKLEAANAILEELDKVLKLLKKGSGPLSGFVLSAGYAEDINAQIRQAKAPFKRYGKDEISDSKGDAVIRSREFILMRKLTEHCMTRGAHMKNYMDAKENIQEILPVYEDIYGRTLSIRDEILLMKRKGEISSK